MHFNVGVRHDFVEARIKRHIHIKWARVFCRSDQMQDGYFFHVLRFQFLKLLLTDNDLTRLIIRFGQYKL